MKRAQLIGNLFKSLKIILLMATFGVYPLAAAQPDSTWVTDISDSVGIDKADGARIWLADINGDNYPDLFWGKGAIGPNMLHVFLNVPNPNPYSKFKRIYVDFTDSSRVNVNRETSKTSRVVDIAAIADLNNDGFPDIVTSIYYHRLEYYKDSLDPGDRSEVYLNDGKGHFKLVSDNGLYQLGLVNTTNLVYLDYDQDGILDLYMGQWFYDYANDAKQHSYLLHGLGNGKFVQVHDAAIEAVAEPFYGGNSTDWNNDGLPDIITSPYCRSTGNVYKNMGDGTFQDVAATVGYTSQLLGGDHGQALCQWAANPGDYNNDGNMDLLQVEVHGGLNAGEGHTHITKNLGPKNDYKYEWQPDLLKRDESVESHLGDQGGTWFDLDGDGKLDVAIGQMAYPQANLEGQERLYILRQDSTGNFIDISKKLGVFYQKEGHTESAADFDLDGDQDLFFSRQHRDTTWADTVIDGQQTKIVASINIYMRIHLLQNNIANKHNWVSVKLTPYDGCNASAIGSKITVYADGLMQTQEVQAGVGHFATQQPFIKNFGLGDKNIIDSVTIRWPQKGAPTLTLWNVPMNLISEINQDGIIDYLHSWTDKHPLIGSQSFYSFGKQSIDSLSGVKILEFKNIGDSVMTIDTIEIQHNDYGAFKFLADMLPVFPITLQPNQTTKLYMTFEPAVHAYFQSNLLIKSNAYNDPNHIIKINGITEHGIISLSEQKVEFENAWIDTLRTREFSITNTGDYQLTINSISIIDNPNNVFSLTENSLPAVLQPGDSIKFTLSFKPSQITTSKATLAINSDYYAAKEMDVDLAGICDGPKPGIKVSALFISFGNVNVGNESDKTFNILNTGTGTLNISSIATDNDDNSIFTFPGLELPMLIDENSSKPLTIKFKPKDSKSYTTNLILNSNAYGADSVKTYIINANGISSVEDESLKLGEMTVSLFPNPATTGHATLRCIPEGMLNKAVNISVISLNGAKLSDVGKYYLTGVEFSADIDISSLTAGKYFLRLDSGDGVCYVPMVVVR